MSVSSAEERHRDEFIVMCQIGRIVRIIKLDKNLLERAAELSGRKTKCQAVNDALTAFVQRRERVGILEFFGTMDMQPTVNDKLRAVKRKRSR